MPGWQWSGKHIEVYGRIGKLGNIAIDDTDHPKRSDFGNNAGSIGIEKEKK